MNYTNTNATVTLGTPSLTLGTTNTNTNATVITLGNPRPSDVLIGTSNTGIKITVNTQFNTNTNNKNYNKDNVVFIYNGKQIALSEIIEMKQKVDYLEKLIEEFMYLPDVGPAFIAAKKHFDLAQENVEKDSLDLENELDSEKLML